jgi:hypothetical protein
MSLQSPALHPDHVVVLFRMAEDGTVSLLNSFGGVRVFHKDHLDPRLTLGQTSPLPFFATLEECEGYLSAGEWGEFRPCLLSYPSAFKSFSHLGFADYATSEA